METPPRAWGRRVSVQPMTQIKGNTPTGVGKTYPPTIALSCIQKHPHGRGEDTAEYRRTGECVETPPRAWGRLNIHHPNEAYPGNTPTGVGKTKACPRKPEPNRKHPHGRGEDPVKVPPVLGMKETPPRAWGRLSPLILSGKPFRNTPTGVGKTVAGHTPA